MIDKKVTQLNPETEVAVDNLAYIVDDVNSFPVSKKCTVQDFVKGGAQDGAVSELIDANLTGDRVGVTDASGKIVVSDITATELSYLDNVYSNIQTQLDVLKAIMISVDTTISVPSTDYPTLNDAFEYLADKVIKAGVLVTIQLDYSSPPTTYTFNDEFLRNHSQGQNILVQGDPTDADNVILHFNNGSNGFVVDCGCVFRISGVTIKGDGVTSDVYGLWLKEGGNCTAEPQVKIIEFYKNIVCHSGSYLRAEDIISQNALDDGYSTNGGDSIVTNINSSNNGGDGINASNGARVYASGGTCSSNGGNGVQASVCASVQFGSGTASSNSTNDLYARSGGFIYAHATTASGLSPSANTRGNYEGYIDKP